jgi:hypothetical protein
MSGYKNNPPKFHHYVPRMYLKHWLDDNDLIYIYNKKTGDIKKSSINGQYFGKNHLNTIVYPDNTKEYWVEKAFAELEGKVAPTLEKITSTSLSNSSQINYDDKLMLSMFVSSQFWRLPINTAFVKSRIENDDFSSLGLSVINQKTGQKVSDDETKEFYENIAGTDLFQKAYPILRSLLYTKDNSEYDNLRYWSFHFQEPGFHFSSDNPILYMSTPDTSSIFKNFILPLSPSILLIATDKQPDAISSELSVGLNILQICHANQFVVGRNEAYLRSAVDEYENNFKNVPLQDIENHIYNKIFND